MKRKKKLFQGGMMWTFYLQDFLIGAVFVFKEHNPTKRCLINDEKGDVPADPFASSLFFFCVTFV